MTTVLPPEAGLPVGVVAEDQKLEAAHENAAAALARLRWHWTMDQDNVFDLVSTHEYAKAVGRSQTIIYRYAKGYKNYMVFKESKKPITITEAIARAAFSAEKQTAIDALANAAGEPFQTAARSWKKVRDVLAIASNRAEKRGTSFEEELPEAAETMIAEYPKKKKPAPDPLFDKFEALDRALNRIAEFIKLIKRTPTPGVLAEKLRNQLQKMTDMVAEADAVLSGKSVSNVDLKALDALVDKAKPADGQQSSLGLALANLDRPLRPYRPSPDPGAKRLSA
jgi:hypothetical protein